MDGIVAKRTLKRSYYESGGISSIMPDKTKEKTKGKFGFKEKIIFKLAIQTVTTLAILTFVFAVKFLNIEIIKKSEIVNSLKTEWNKNYTFKEIKEISFSALKKVYVFVKPIIPTKVEEVVKIGMTKLNGFINNDENIDNVINVNNKEVNIYEESNNSESENKEIEEDNVEQETKNENIGTSVEEKEKGIAVSSSLSYQDEIVAKIESLNIDFVKPVSGTITSNFGAREVIFEGIDSYHTGIDIGAKSGTKVVSSISGTVTVATYNQYNGNYIEVTNGDIVTKYLHLSKISVKKGTSVKAGTKIGEVGSTGLSTGPHLHFEVVYDGIKIDPRTVVDI